MINANFTGEIKKEIIKNGFENSCCKIAALAAFLRATGSIIGNGENIGFEFVTESEFVAEYFIALFEEVFGAELKIVQATTDNRNGKDRLIFQCISEKSIYILMELGILCREENTIDVKLDLDPYIIENDCCKKAYIKGAFLGSGSCSLPKLENSRSGYHLEIVFFNQTIAKSFCLLLSRYEILAKYIFRKGSYVVYLKSRESISDFLYVCSAENALDKLDKLAYKKDERNQINRIANCLQKNYDKSVMASVKQIRAIEQLQASGILNELEEPLQRVARIRLKDKEASLKELAEQLSISKSCLNHRLRKLVKISEEIDKGE